MGFASAWLQERALFQRFISEPPDNRLGIIVVIPAYNEPGITSVLDSLASCYEPDCRVEVIVVVNSPLEASPEQLENNRLTILNIESWKKKNNTFFRLYYLSSPQMEGWGVGMARKTGMDEALRRFDHTGNTEGVILNLDADCLVEVNYLVSVSDELLKRKDRKACSIYFEHPLKGEEFPEEIWKAISLYELHLRYYFHGLLHTGFPYVFHTIGSAMAVKALPYMKAGGMNRKQAGEDFYFIQKLVPQGGYFSLNSTAVYPSPRKSLRVPFGTGATMERLSTKGEEFLSYNIKAFNELKEAFGLLKDIYDCAADDLVKQYELLPQGIKHFTGSAEWTEKMKEIKGNTSGFESFRKRFFAWFNMFRVVKFLNFAHRDYLEKKPVTSEAPKLLKATGVSFDSIDPVELLLRYRSLEKET